MAAGVDTQILEFDSSSPPSPSSSTGCEFGELNVDRYLGFQDTVPFDDTMVIDSPLVENHLEELCFDTEVVDDLSIDEEGEPEVVLDSEDEGLSESRVVSSLYGKTYRRRGSKGSSSNSESIDGKKDLRQLYDRKTGSLDCAASLESGESSQQALEFVDNFIKLNNVNISQGNEPRKFVKEKSQPVSCLRGVQSLAKMIKQRTPVKETFEWDDNHQNEEVFSSKRMKSSSSFDKWLMDKTAISHHKSGGYQSLGTDHEDDERHTFRNPSNGSIRDSDVNWQMDFSDRGLVVNEIGKDVPDMYDIGIGTQIAVEAIEALAFALPDHVQAGSEYRGPETTSANSPKRIMDGRARLGQHSFCNSGPTHLLSNASPSIRRKRSVRKFSKKVPSLFQTDSHVERTNNVSRDDILMFRRKTKVVAVESETTTEHSEIDLNVSTEETDGKLAEYEQPGGQVADLTGFVKVNEWNYPKGKRTSRRMQSHFDGSNSIHAHVSITKGKENINSFRCMKMSANDEKTSTKSPVTGRSSCTKIVREVSSNNMPYGYQRKSCNRNLPKSSLLKELVKLSIPDPVPYFTWKDLRRRRDSACIRVLFSQHLDDDIIKQQKKITARLGISITLNPKNATHYVADMFARTMNMLEAIAAGKPVVTHLWLENSAQAGCLLDERNYILRDDKKEKEIGFSMPVSLARASQFPLLKGRRVCITPNVKPNKEMTASLVKAVQGQVVERSRILALKDPKFLDDLLILSSELDEEICRPLLDRGVAVCSSELLLNGIVIQKLECERHRIFTRREKQTGFPALGR